MFKFTVVVRTILFGFVEHYVIVYGDDIQVKEGRLVIINTTDDDIELLTEFNKWERFDMEEFDE